MNNAIALINKQVPLLDEVYKFASFTSALETSNALVRETTDAKTVQVAEISTQGLGNYSRKTGFVDGDVTLEWKSHTFRYDRGRSFSIDAMDDLESVGLAFGYTASEFLRVQVVPEIDAVRFAEYSSNAGSKVYGALESGDAVVTALDDAQVIQKDKEVDMSNAKIFLTPTIYNLIKNSTKFSRPLTPSQNPNRNFGSYDNMEVIEVPQRRFYTKCTLNDGVTEGQKDGGFVNAGSPINFLMVKPECVTQITKHAKLRVFAPDVNQKADAYKIDYRIYHDAWVLNNKKDGLFAHINGTEE